MRNLIYILIGLLVGLFSCKNEELMLTKIEKELINSASVEVPFYVLQTDVEPDSAFLRLKAKDVDVASIGEDQDLALLIARMKTTLLKEFGVGLAAPQVGISRNVFLFMRMDQPDSLIITTAINPKIVDHPNETVCFEGDGCLSIPDVGGNSIRYPWVDVEYYTEEGELIRQRLSGYSRETDFTGVIFQHEFDHLQGVLFIDKLWEEKEN